MSAHKGHVTSTLHTYRTHDVFFHFVEATFERGISVFCIRREIWSENVGSICNRQNTRCVKAHAILQMSMCEGISLMCNSIFTTIDKIAFDYYRVNCPVILRFGRKMRFQRSLNNLNGIMISLKFKL